MRRVLPLVLLCCYALPVQAATRLDDESVSQGYINAVDCVGAGISCARSGITGTLTVSGGGNSFETISVPAGTNPVADSSTDTLTITETDTPLIMTGTAGTDTIDITTIDCAANEIMKRNAGDTAWACAADAGGTDTNADKEFIWPMGALLPLEAADSIPPLAKDAGTNLDLLPVDFDASTDECRTFTFLAPPDITSGGTVTFSVTWYSASATTGSVVLDVRHNSGVAENVDPDAALTTVAAAADAVAGTAGQITLTTWTETQTNLGWVATDLVVGVICRDANHASDNLVGDMRALTFAIRVPRS